MSTTTASQDIALAALLQRLRLAYREDGVPELQVSMYLSRQPSLKQAAVGELVERGRLQLQIDLGPADSPRGTAEPFPFVERVDIKLLAAPNERVLAQGTIYGPVGHTALYAALDQADCRAVYRMLQNEESTINIAGTFYQRDETGTHSFPFSLPLASIFGEAFHARQDFHPQQLVAFYYFDPKSDALLPAPRIARFRKHRSRDPRPGPTPMVLANNKLSSVSAYIQPAHAYPAASLLQSSGTAYVATNQLYYLSLQNFTPANSNQETAESLPIVSTQSVNFWFDRLDRKKIWYYPVYNLLSPPQNQLPQHSPFRFDIYRIGTDQQGNPILEGEVWLSIAAGQPSAVTRKLSSDAELRAFPVEMIQESFRLEIPFMDSDGQEQLSKVSAAEISRADDKILLLFRLTNNWLRACYGAISTEGYQPGRNVKIQIASLFRGYERVKVNTLAVALGGKISKLPVQPLGSRAAVTEPTFDMERKTLVLPDGEMRFRDQPVGFSACQKASRARSGGRPTANLALPATAYSQLAVAQPSLAATLAPKLDVTKVPIQSNNKYVLREFGRKTNIDVFFPCDQFGLFYRERQNETDEWVSIACKEPYRLGTIPFELYRELAEYRTEQYRVYRSTQSPSQFFILPIQYRISRFPATEEAEKAYRPCMALYAALDESDNFANSNCVLEVVLEPDIPFHERVDLRQRLQALTPYEPAISYPGEIEAQEDFSWSIPPGSDFELSTLTVGHTVRLTISVGIMQTLNLRAMLRNGLIAGQGNFTLPDDTTYSIDLYLDLERVIGPWIGGPLQLQDDVGSLQLINRVQNPVQVTELRRTGSDGGQLPALPVNRKLPGGGVYEVAHSVTEGEQLTPVTTLENAELELEEINSFIDDITCQVMFLTTTSFFDHAIELIVIEVRFTALPDQIRQTTLEPGRSFTELNLTLPLTNYLTDRSIAFRTTVVQSLPTTDTSESDGQLTELEGTETQEIVSSWRTFDIGAQGNIINLTTNLLFND